MPRSVRLSLHDHAGHAFTYELARSLARRGVDVEYGWSATASHPHGRLVEADGLSVVPFGEGWVFDKYRVWRRMVGEVRLGWAGARAIRARRPTHVVVANMPVLCVLLTWVASRSVGARRVLWFQDAQSEIAAALLGRRRMVSRVARLLESVAVRGADLVVTISAEMRDTVVALGARPADTVVLENWAPLHALDPEPRDNEWARAHGTVGVFTYLYSGTLARKHRPERLLELAAELDRTGAGRLVVVSSGEGADHLRVRGAHLSSLTVLPYQPFDVLPSVLAAADVLVVLLEPEANASSVPSKTWSYLCAGRAVLGAMPLDNLASRTVVERAGAGLVVAPDDAAGFLDAARRLREDDDLRAGLAANGRRYAEEMFGEDSVIDAFERATGLRDGPRVALVQLTLAGYRRAFVDEFRARLGDRLVLGYGDEHLDPSLRRGIDPAAGDVRLTNRFLWGRRVVFQPGYRRVLRRADVWILEMNPRVLNTWLAVFEARVRGRRTVLWGHFLGRRHGEVGPRLMRRVQIRLADAVLAYTDEDGRSFREVFGSTEVYVAPNAIDRAEDLVSPAEGARSDLLYVGRLVSDKRVDLLIEGFGWAVRAGRLPAQARLVVIGDGPQREELQRLVTVLGLDGSVVFEAGTYAGEELTGWYAGAVAAVCGGYVGLNLTQSLSRGVPFVYPLHANHAPEVSLAEPGVNAVPFDPATPEAVADALVRVWSMPVDRSEIQRAATRYTVGAMVDGFVVAAVGSECDRC